LGIGKLLQYMARLERRFFSRPTIIVAKELLGKKIYFRGRVAKVVETEAYLGAEDLASHARFISRKRNQLMFGQPGVAYVYFTYGMYHMLNVVTEESGRAGAVLIRSVEPVKGIHLSTDGPGKLTRAFGVTLAENGVDLLESSFFYLEDGKIPREIVESSRIGVGYSGEYKDKPWRFYVKGNPFVSKS
jgi:DNA-3-methyladenine glycosylase